MVMVWSIIELSGRPSLDRLPVPQSDHHTRASIPSSDIESGKQSKRTMQVDHIQKILDYFVPCYHANMPVN